MMSNVLCSLCKGKVHIVSRADRLHHAAGCDHIPCASAVGMLAAASTVCASLEATLQSSAKELYSWLGSRRGS